MENLEELFKKFVYTGIGMATLAKERLEKTIEEIVEKNKMNTNEGEKIMKDFIESTESKTKEIKETINKIIEDAKTNLRFARKSEFEKLKNRVKILEEIIK